MANWVHEVIFFVLMMVSILSGIEGRAFDYDDQYQEGTTRYLGRVQMKVFRGPTAQSGEWAPHGYWVKQPADPGHR